MMNYIFKDFTYDKRGKLSPSEQLYYHAVDKIISYQVIPNQPFPLARDLALLLDLSETDVQSAYGLLTKNQYCEPLESSIVVRFISFPEVLGLSDVQSVEQIWTAHQMDQSIQIIEEYPPSLAKEFVDWMMIPKQQKRHELHRLHVGKDIPFMYSVIAMDPEYLSINREHHFSVKELLKDWSLNHVIEWTTMVLSTISLPASLANHFAVLEGSSAFALRSSALNNNGVMLATFMYVFTPRVHFSTDVTLNPSNSSH